MPFLFYYYCTQFWSENASSENVSTHRGDRKPSPVMITCCILTLVPCFQAKRLESKWVKSGYVLDRKLALPYFYLIGDLSQSTSSQKSRKKQTVKYCFIFWLKVLGISSANLVMTNSNLVMTNFECWILNIRLFCFLKFGHSEKHTKFEEIFH